MTLRRLVVAVHPSDEGRSGWVRLLEQERMGFVQSEDADPQVILFSDWLPPWLETYVSRGGVAVISGAPDADGLLPRGVPALIHRFISPVDGTTTVEAPGLARLFPGRGFGRARLHEDRVVKGGVDPDVYPVVLERKVGNGVLIFTGIPLARLLVARGDSLRTFSPHTSVTERVCSIDKAEILDILMWMLHRAFHHLQVPYVRPARFPNGARSVFVMRVDVDGVFGQHARRIAEASTAAGVRANFFFNGSLCDRAPGDLSNWMRSHEVGHHGYEHNVFPTVQKNIANLRLGAEWVREHIGMEPAGFVAPRGLWNDALDQALMELGYGFSSDFALDFDSLPFRTDCGVLQIPVHPYSPERATVHAAECDLPTPTPEAVLGHYLAVIDDQCKKQRVAYIYAHPEVFGQMAEKVLPTLFANVRARLPSLTLGELAKWWQQRESVDLDLEQDEASGDVRITVHSERPSHLEVLDHGRLKLVVNGSRREVPPAARSVVPVAVGALNRR